MEKHANQVNEYNVVIVNRSTYCRDCPWTFKKLVMDCSPVTASVACRRCINKLGVRKCSQENV